MNQNSLKSVISQNKNLLIFISLLFILIISAISMVIVLDSKTSESTQANAVLASEETKKIEENDQITKITFIESSIEMRVGEELTPDYIITPSTADSNELKWTTEDENIAAINNGIITANSAGTTKITASTKDNVKAILEVVVVESNDPIVEASSITLNKEESDLKEGEVDRVVATILPEDTFNKTIFWTSSDESIATIDNGTIKALKVGTATITATTSNGLSSSLKVVVSNNVISVTGLSLNKTSVSLNVGQTTSISASISPDNATNKSVTWKSSNTSIATVNSSGTIKGIKAGTTTVTAYSSGGKSASVTVKVTGTTTPSNNNNNNQLSTTDTSIHVTSIAIKNSSPQIYPGESVTLQTVIQPSNATNKTISWSTSNSNVATVSNGTVTAKGVGTATITAKTNDGGKTATINVTVVKKEVAVTGVTLNKTTATLTDGESVQLTATVSPSNATLKDVIWSSSNSDLATVDSTGKVIAISAGTGTTPAKVTITATTKSEAKKVTATITINQKITVVYHRNTSSSDTTTITQTFTYGTPYSSSSTNGNRFGYDSNGKSIFSSTTGDFGTWSKKNYTLKGWSYHKDASENNLVCKYCTVQNLFITQVYNKQISYQTSAKTIDLYAVWEES